MTAGGLIGAIVVSAIAVLLLTTFWPFVLCILGALVAYIGFLFISDADKVDRFVGLLGILLGVGIFSWGAMMVWVMLAAPNPREAEQ
jgi:hypothetical protein